MPRAPAPLHTLSRPPKVRACISTGCAPAPAISTRQCRDRLIAGAMVPAALVVKAQKFRRWYQTQVLKLFKTSTDDPRAATPPPSGGRPFVLDGVEMPVRPNISIYTQPISFIRPSRSRPVPVLDPTVWSSPRRGTRTSRCARVRAGAGGRVRRAAGKILGKTGMDIDLPEVGSPRVRTFDAYEKALITNDLGGAELHLPRCTQIRYRYQQISTATTRSRHSAARVAGRADAHDFADMHHLRPRFPRWPRRCSGARR